MNPDLSARRAYNVELNQLPVPDAALAVPLTAIERSLQRHKVRNRPPLPLNRQDLILQGPHLVTNDGRRLLLIDDGMADRMLVFCTNENLQRFDKYINVVINGYCFLKSTFEKVKKIKNIFIRT
jgi:hypothetical protein